VIAQDARFRVGANLDGILDDHQAGLRLNRPFLWLQSDGSQPSSYVRVRDQLFDSLQAGGDLLNVGGSSHDSFTDSSFYQSPMGQSLLGEHNAAQAAGDIIASFVGSPLGAAGSNLEQALARHPTIRMERHVAPLTLSEQGFISTEIRPPSANGSHA